MHVLGRITSTPEIQLRVSSTLPRFFVRKVSKLCHTIEGKEMAMMSELDIFMMGLSSLDEWRGERSPIFVIPLKFDIVTHSLFCLWNYSQ